MRLTGTKINMYIILYMYVLVKCMSCVEVETTQPTKRSMIFLFDAFVLLCFVAKTLYWKHCTTV